MRYDFSVDLFDDENLDVSGREGRGPWILQYRMQRQGEPGNKHVIIKWLHDNEIQHKVSKHRHIRTKDWHNMSVNNRGIWYMTAIHFKYESDILLFKMKWL